jgi:hypothetical protein
MSPVAASLPPIRLTIPGNYWDSQIYSGDLILFGLDGSILTLDWTRLIGSMPLPDDLRMVAEAALLGSARFYSPEVLRVIQDPEVQPIIVAKFARLEALTRQMTVDIAGFDRKADNPFPFPHNDSEFHYGSLYVGARSGVFRVSSASVHAQRNTLRKLTDAPTLDIAAKYAAIAVAAGSDGLLEIQTKSRGDQTTVRVAPNACSTCEWTYASLVGSDNCHKLFVAAFALVREDSADPRNRRKIRRFEGVLTNEQLFGEGSGDTAGAIQWGAKDKLYQYRNGRFDVVRNSSNGTTSFQRLGSRDTSANFELSQFVAVRVAPFGSVLEFDDRLEVLLNSGNVLTLPGEPVNWRVYPRSMNYLNHLHVIYEDRIEIIAVTSDYFVRPDARMFGTEAISRDEHIGQRQ